MGNVRAILWQHMHQAHPEIPAPSFEDPNEATDAAPFQAALMALDTDQQHRLGADYVQLWARTFRTLSRHIRGQPERALAIFVQEVLPYLCDQRLAARMEPGPQRTRIVTDVPLPMDYVAGMAAGFAHLSGANASAEVRGDSIDVYHPLRAADRAARWTRHVARLRIPLLLTSVLAACTGLAMASAAPWQDMLAVLIGTLAAQSGANALHDLRVRQPRHVLSAPALGRGWLVFQAIGSYLLAGAGLAWLLPHRPWLMAFAAAGFLLGALYVRFKDQGWGPAIALLSHGPLTVGGAAYAVGVTLGPEQLLPALPTGALAAAILYLDDLADRPLDQAAGSRTLVVRLAPSNRFWAFAAFLAVALLGVLGAWSGHTATWLGPIVALAASAALIARHVGRHMDDPAGLAWPRSALLGHYALTVTITILLLRLP